MGESGRSVWLCHIYTGKVAGEREFGLGGNVIKRLTRSITGRNHTVYCDNFFTSAPLFKDFLKDKIYACGTYNHTRKYPKRLKSHAKSGLKNRGEYRYAEWKLTCISVAGHEASLLSLNKPVSFEGFCSPQTKGWKTCGSSLSTLHPNLQQVHGRG